MSNFPRFARPLTVVVVILGWLTAAAVAHAEDTTAAREHYQKGTAFFDLGKYQDAIKEFEAAYEAKNDPAFLYNLAQAHRLAGNPEQALRFYRTYLRRNPNPPNRADIEDKIKQLERLVDQKTASQTSPPTQTIQPSLPPAPPAPSPGLQPAPPAMPPNEAPMAPPPGVPPALPMTATPPPGAATPLQPPPPAAPPRSGLRTAGWVLGGVGVTALVVGLALGSDAQSSAKQINDAAAANKTYTADLKKIDDQGRLDQSLELVFIPVGLAAIAAGVACYIYGAPSESGAGAHAAVTFTPTVTPRAAAGTLQVRF